MGGDDRRGVMEVEGGGGCPGLKEGYEGLEKVSLGATRGHQRTPKGHQRLRPDKSQLLEVSEEAIHS